MVKKHSRLRDADQLFYLATGKHIRQYLTPETLAKTAARLVPLLKNTQAPPVPDPSDPYYILGVNPAHSTRVIKATFRAITFDLHPDTGENPNPEKFQAAIEAYNKIMKERGET